MPKRYLAPSLARDQLFAEIASACPMAALFYVMALPHTADDCTLPTKDPAELRLLVCPGVEGVTRTDVAAWIELLTTTADGDGHTLMQWAPDGRLRYPPLSFYKQQTYIPEGKQRATLEPAENAPSISSAEASAKSVENTEKLAMHVHARPSFSFSPSPSFSSPPSGGETPDADAPGAPIPLEPVAPDEPTEPTEPIEPTEPTVRAVPKPPKAKPMGHPAVQVYRRLTDISPKEVIRVAIEAAVPAADEEAVERFRQAATAWVQSGYSARNVTGMLEWYRDGIPPGKRPKVAPRRTAPAPLPGPISYPTAEEREEHRRLGGASGLNGAASRPVPPTDDALKAAAERLVAAGKVTPQQIEAARRASKHIGQPGATP